MTRVAWLYLPDFATDRIRRSERATRPAPPAPPPEPARTIARETAVRNGGGWRPGARWAQDDAAPAGSDDWLARRLARKRARKAAIQAEIDRLPQHQRPPMRELGRRSEPASHPFKAGRADDGRTDLTAASPRMTEPRAAADLAGVPRARDHGFPPRHDLDAMSGRPQDGMEVRAHPFRPMPVDEARALAAAEPSDFGGHVRCRAGSLDSVRNEACPSDGARRSAGERPPYDRAGAFWEQGRVLGPLIARAVTGAVRTRPEAPSASSARQPLVTAVREGNRMVLAAACPAARALGLAPGSALTRARAMVPGLDVRDADPVGEAADLRRLAHHAARHWTPLAGPCGADGLWLDIAGSAHLFGGEERFCARALGFVRRLGFAARIAVADTRAAARALALSGGRDVASAPPGGSAAAVAALPLDALRLEPAALATARRLGLETVAALMALPRGPLVRRFGRAVADRLDEAAGVRAEPFDPVAPRRAVAVERRFFDPVMTAEGVERAMGALTAALVEGLAARGLGARALLLRLERVDRHAQHLAIGLARPCRDAGHMLRLLAMRVGEVEPGFGIETMRLTAVRADPLAAEPVPGALAGPRPADGLDLLVDRLVTRIGGRRLYRVGGVESDVPERSVARLPPLGQPCGWPDRWPRPVRLIEPPEPVEQVLAELPDRPPRRFRWRGRSHRVVRADGPERIYGEWWRRDAERDAVRDYFQVEDEAGARFWLYRRGDGVDGRTGDLSWHIHGLFG